MIPYLLLVASPKNVTFAAVNHSRSYLFECYQSQCTGEWIIGSELFKTIPNPRESVLILLGFIGFFIFHKKT